jgi:hypothetical protein
MTRGRTQALVCQVRTQTEKSMPPLGATPVVDTWRCDDPYELAATSNRALHRPEATPWQARYGRWEILEIIGALCNPRSVEFRLDAPLNILNPENNLQRRWAIQSAVARMYRGDNG